MLSFRRLGLALSALVLLPGTAFGQIPGFSSALSRTTERVSENHWRLTGAVEVARGDVKFYADRIDYFTDTDRLVAEGNVVFEQTTHRIAADRADFSTQTSLGTFFNASGIASLGDRPDMARFGTLEPDVYFYGETVEKIGPDRYRITRGGFTTCVQPTPRWEVTSSSVVLNVDDYALLRNSFLRVKGVPVLYLPVLYYPIQRDDRASGFLLPTYGSSTIKGQTFSNAFFWAYSRSQDVTLLHDWFSRTGQGGGADYRYASSRGSGDLRTYFLREHQATYESNGVERVVPARRSYEIRGSASQGLGRRLQARGRADYFSDITVQQTYHSDIYEASRRQRLLAGSLSGGWGPYILNGSYDRTEYFFGTTSSTVTGGTPRITAARAERPVGRTNLYFSASGEYFNQLRRAKESGNVRDEGLARVDIVPQLRFPFTRLQFLTINSSLAWRSTFWSDSRDARGARIEAPISRRYVDMRAAIVGPVLLRIWDGPANRYKHTIEPFLNLQRTTAINNFDRIIQLDAVDSIVGQVASSTYGVNSRLYAKRADGGPSTPARELLSATIRQTYYTDARAAQYDLRYQTSFSGVAPTHFSPVSLQVRATPTERVTGALRAEYDTRYGALRTIGADATVSDGDWLQATAGWSQRRFIAKLPGFNDRSRLDHFVNATTTVRFRQNRYGVVHSFHYDVLRGSFLQQRFAGYYNAQCCGVAAEFQTWDLSRSAAPVPQDRRFNLSITLAGLGSFSNFFGALGDTPR